MKFHRNDKGKPEGSLISTVIIGVTVFMLLAVCVILIFQIVLNDKLRAAPIVGTDTVYTRHYAFITENNKDTFWLDAYEAAKETGRELGIYVEMMGSQLSGSYSSSELMDMAIASNVDGIIVNPVDDATKEKIDEAADRGIDVGTIFNDMMGGSRICFIGAGNYKMGQEYGGLIGNTIGSQEGNVLVLIDSSDSGNQNLIYSSIKEHLKDTQLEVNNMLIDTHNAFEAEEAIRNIVLGTPRNKPDVLVCLSALSTKCAYQSIVDYNAVGHIKIIGYYVGSEVIQEAVQKQIIEGVVMVDARQMGSRSVEALDEYQSKGRVNEYGIVNTKIINSSNVDEYIGSIAEE